MQKFLVLLLCLGGMMLPKHSTAQSAIPEDSQTEIKGMVRASVIHWLDPILPSAHFRVDYRVAPRTYLRHEVGYFFDLGFDEPEAIEGIDGIRLRTAYRSYFQDVWQRPQLTYLEFSVGYRYLDLTIAGDFWRDNFNFQQRINYSVWQHSITTGIHAGITRAVGEHWRIDLGIGAAIRCNIREYSDVPDDATYDTNGPYLGWDYNSRSGVSFGLSMPLVIALGYQW